MKNLLMILLFNSLCFSLIGQVYIEQSKQNPKEAFILYKHHLKIDTFKYIVTYPLVSIFDFKFNGDTTICTIIFKRENIGFTTLRFYKKENWMAKKQSSIGKGYQWNIKNDTLIQSEGLPSLISFDMIQIKDGISYTNRKTRNRVKTEKYYFLKFDENDKLIETSNE